MPHELFLTTRQKTKITNAFVNNMSANIKLSKSQLNKIIQLGEFFGKTLGYQGKKVLLELVVPLPREVLSKLATKATSSAIDKLERKICGKGDVRAEKGFTSLISNEDMDNIIKIVESLNQVY